MPGRKIPLVSGEIYHVLNRGVASQPTFIDWRSYQRAIETMFYYQNLQPPQRYSLFILQARKKREEILNNLRQKRKFRAEIIAYCFMPNHFHLLLRQVVENGISKFLGDFANSYTRYFNTRAKREGPIFRGNFKAIRIETEEQLLHVSRYIHLNPYSSYLVKNLEALKSYPYSSLPEYLAMTQRGYCQTEVVLGSFPKREDYEKFLFDQADYQRSLKLTKHLWLES